MQYNTNKKLLSELGVYSTLSHIYRKQHLWHESPLTGPFRRATSLLHTIVTYVREPALIGHIWRATSLLHTIIYIPIFSFKAQAFYTTPFQAFMSLR